jgi:HAD superfamily hydrolase (TIGR01509 family)
MNGMTTAVIFDVEGTLIDCAALVIECWKVTLAAHGLFYTAEELHPYLGMDGNLMLAKLAPDLLPKKRKTLLDEQGRRYRDEFMARAKPIPGVRELFKALSESGNQVALATTSQPDELRHYLKLLDVSDFISATCCGGEVQHMKPAPDLIEAAIKKLPARPSGVIAVGDTPYDARSALSAGAMPYGVLTGGFTKAELRAAGCAAVASNMTELETLLTSRPSGAQARPKN